MVGHEPPQEPQHLEIAPSLALEPPARLHAVQVAVDVELQESRGMISGPARGRRLDAIKTQIRQVQRIDERVDHADRILLVNPIVEALRQERRLPPICSLHEALHDVPRESSGES